MTNQEVLSEETDPELATIAHELPQPKIHPDLQDELDEYLDFMEVTKPKEFLDYNEENSKKVEQMDPRYVVTDHDTCDSPMFSVGWHDFGPNPRCCWFTHGWHILTNPWEGVDDMIRTGGYAQCVECNIGGDSDDEGDPDCKTCEGDGWVNYYYDEFDA